MKLQISRIKMRSKLMNSFDLARFVSKKAFVKYIDIVFWIICIIYYTIKITSR